jgi:hypothetical protein
MNNVITPLFTSIKVQLIVAAELAGRFLDDPIV